MADYGHLIIQRTVDANLSRMGLEVDKAESKGGLNGSNRLGSYWSVLERRHVIEKYGRHERIRTADPQMGFLFPSRKSFVSITIALIAERFGSSVRISIRGFLDAH